MRLQGGALVLVSRFLESEIVMIPKKVIEAAEERIAIGGQLAKIGEYKGFEVYTCEYQEEMTIGLPELYLWDGSRVKTVCGEEAPEIMGSVS